MEKIKTFDGDGKTREERETCFPQGGEKIGRRGVCMR